MWIDFAGCLCDVALQNTHFFKIEPIFCFIYLHTNDQLLLLAGFCHPTLVCSVEMYCFTLTNYVCTPAPHFHSQLSTVCTAGYIDFFFLSFFSACHDSTFSSLFKLNWGCVMWKWLVLLEWCPIFGCRELRACKSVSSTELTAFRGWRKVMVLRGWSKSVELCKVEEFIKSRDIMSK